MVKVSIKFDDNFYTLDILEKQILFNYNLFRAPRRSWPE